MSSVGRSQWLYGVVAGVDATRSTTLMAELDGTARTNFGNDALIVNAGLRHKLTDRCIEIRSLGHEVRSATRETLASVTAVSSLFTDASRCGSKKRSNKVCAHKNQRS